MIFLITSLMVVLFICEIALVAYCNVKKRSLILFSLFIVILAVTALMVTGDITVAYAG